MIVRTLVEDTKTATGLGSEHGLSLHIETNGYKILFDVGASDLFLRNANEMNVSVSDVDYLVISHGHYDHGGGLRAFLKTNTKAKVFIHQLAFEKYYAQRLDSLDYIGLDEELKQNKQIVLISGLFSVNENLRLFANTTQRNLRLKSNSSLFMEQDGQIIEDVFNHEQNLIIKEDGKTVLLTGCAHNGIINILKEFNDLQSSMPDYVIGGFHLSSRSSGGNESFETIDRIGQFLTEAKAMYYTGHCTGIGPYRRLKSILGTRIEYLSTGSKIVI